MYIGPTTDDAPTAIPPIKRKVINKIQKGVNAQPTADTRYRSAITVSTFFLPYCWAGAPAIKEPRTVPIKLAATVKPCQPAERFQRCWMVFSAPEITAVSKPKRKPPNAAINEIRTT